MPSCAVEWDAWGRQLEKPVGEMDNYWFECTLNVCPQEAENIESVLKIIALVILVIYYMDK